MEEIHGATKVSRTREAPPYHRDDVGENCTVEGLRNSDLGSVGNMTTKEKKKGGGQQSRLSYNPVHTVHLKMPPRVVSM